jgi:multidrug resistance efflux pump
VLGGFEKKMRKVYMKSWKNLTLLLAALALILTACGGRDAVPTPQSTPLPVDAVIAEGHLVPNDDQTLSFTVPGKVAEILVEKGQKVREGDVLVRLADKEQAEAALAAAQLELTTAQQAYDQLVRTEGLSRADAWQAYMDAQKARATAQRKWDNLNVDDIEDRIDDAQAEVNDRKKDLEDAQDEFDKYVNLDRDNSKRKSAKDKLDDAQTDYDNAVAKLESTKRERDAVRAALDQALADETEAKHQYDISQDGPNAEQKALAEARLNNAKAQVASAENNLTNYELKAPFDGEVMDTNVSVNQMVGPETWAVVVADTSQWFIDTSDLTELDVVNVAVGQNVSITADALPGVTMTGVVQEISQTYKSQSGDILYTVRIKVNDLDPRMRWGMTVEVTFEPLE